MEKQGSETSLKTSELIDLAISALEAKNPLVKQAIVCLKLARATFGDTVEDNGGKKPNHSFTVMLSNGELKTNFYAPSTEEVIKRMKVVFNEENPFIIDERDEFGRIVFSRPNTEVEMYLDKLNSGENKRSHMEWVDDDPDLVNKVWKGHRFPGEPKSNKKKPKTKDEKKKTKGKDRV